MKRLEKSITLPDDMDKECIGICDLLNTLPTVETVESCCGHCRRPFWVWFHCYDLGVLSRLGRAVERNYSDGNWEIVVDSSDIAPYGMFWLRSKCPFDCDLDMKESLNGLIENIAYWFDDKFDEYFTPGLK